MNGTPKTLIEAIQNGMCIGPLSSTHEEIRKHVKDFMSQKFSCAMLRVESPEELERLKLLWFALTGEKIHETEND